MAEVARVYAEALFDVAKEKGKLDQIGEELNQFADAVDSNRDGRGQHYSRERDGDDARPESLGLAYSSNLGVDLLRLLRLLRKTSGDDHAEHDPERVRDGGHEERVPAKPRDHERGDADQARAREGVGADGASRLPESHGHEAQK